MSSSVNSFIRSRSFAMQAALGIYAPRNADADTDGNIYEYEEDDRKAENGFVTGTNDEPNAGKESANAGRNTLRPKI